MSKLMKTNGDYAAWVFDLKERYRRSQIKASVAVNTVVQEFYWSIGFDIANRDAEIVYGAGFYENLSRDLIAELPDARGFSPANLRYMKRFYELFPASEENVPQLAEHSPINGGNVNVPQVAEHSFGSAIPRGGTNLFAVPWGHIRLLIEKCKGNSDKALFYARKTVENNWSRAVLLNFLDTDLYERQGKAITNFAATLPAPQGDLAQEITKDPYNFDFLAMRERYDERELKDALMDNITKFLLELGTGFAFVGREYRLTIGGREKFIDMLFYHIRLRCYVVLEVKVADFDPSYMGQLGTYVVAVNHQLKTDDDAPTVGLLVCKSLDKVEAQYALEGTSQPIGVSGYELAKLLPDDFKGSLPTIEEIERELDDVAR